MEKIDRSCDGCLVKSRNKTYCEAGVDQSDPRCPCKVCIVKMVCEAYCDRLINYHRGSDDSMSKLFITEDK